MKARFAGYGRSTLPDGYDEIVGGLPDFPGTRAASGLMGIVLLGGDARRSRLPAVFVGVPALIQGGYLVYGAQTGTTYACSNVVQFEVVD